MPNVVTVENVRMHTAKEQLAFELLSNGRFAGPRKASQPNNCPPMAAPNCSRVGSNFSFGPKDIFAFCNGAIRINAAENRSATTDLPVIYNNKPSEVRNAIVIVEDEWSTGLDCKSADFVSL